MLLQTNSVVNSIEVPTPWHTVEMDATFRTMAPVRDTGEEDIARFSTYRGLVEVLSNTLNVKYGAVQQKILVPQVIKIIERFRAENKLEPESTFDSKTSKMIARVEPLLEGLPANSSLKKTFENLTALS
jgi:hypothetical protein